MPCGLNLTEAGALGGAMIGVFNSIATTPCRRTPAASAGSHRAAARTAWSASRATRPAARSPTTNLADRVVEPRAARDRRARPTASAWPRAARSSRPSAAVISGTDPRRRRRAVRQPALHSASPAAPARRHRRLADHRPRRQRGLLPPRQHRGRRAAASDPWSTSARLVPDSEGAGRYRGAPGLHVEFGPVGCTIEALYANDGTRQRRRGRPGRRGRRPVRPASAAA